MKCSTVTKESLSGFTLLEVMLAVALLALLVVGFLGAWSYGQDALVSSGNRLRALYLAEEGLDALRNIRDQSYGAVAAGTHGLSTTSNQWSLSGASDVNGIFTRSIQIADVGANRKVATATVTWQQNAVRRGTVTLATELTNWLRRGWNTLARTFVLNFAGNTNFLKIQVVGNYAYVIRDGTGTELLIFDVTSPDAPVLVGETIVAGSPSDLSVQGNYVYIATSSNFAEIYILDITDPTSPQFVGSYNDAGNADATAIVVQGNVAYMTQNGENELVTVDVSDPIDPLFMGGENLSGNPLDLAVRWPYAYVATTDNAAEVVTVAIGSPNSPSLVSSLNLAGNQDAASIAIAPASIVVGRLGAGLYTATSSSAGALSLLGTSALASDINALAVDASGQYAFASTALAAGEFRVYSIATPATPSLLAFFDNTGATSGVLRGIAYRASPERVYAVGDVDAAEMLIYAPQ